MEDKISSDFFIAMSKRIGLLKKDGLVFDLRHFSLSENNQIKITILGKEERTFTLSIEKNTFFLDNPEERKAGGRPTFMLDDMVTYLLILANQGQVIGKLPMPGSESRRPKHFLAVVPT